MPKYPHYFLLVTSLFWSTLLLAQDSIPSIDLDERYREDQFYVGVTYNLITNVPDGVNLKGVSGGVNFGFLRDMPINEERTMALAVGLGMAFDRYGSTLFIGEEENEQTLFSVLDSEIDYSFNRLSTAALEIPLEFRWRTSSASNYKFWRIYGGVRANYTYWYRSSFKQPNNEVSQTSIEEFEPLQFAATLSFGYSTFNFYAYYNLNPLFKNARVTETQEEISFRALKLGVIFYIL